MLFLNGNTGKTVVILRDTQQLEAFDLLVPITFSSWVGPSTMMLSRITEVRL